MTIQLDRRVAAAVLGASLTVLCTAPSALGGDLCDTVIWCDNFDNYALGILVGQDCGIAGCPEDAAGCPTGLSWQPWDFGRKGGLSPVVDTFSNSAPHSLEILGGAGSGGTGSDDMVHTFHDLRLENIGRFQYSADIYLPDGYTGNHYFILLNTYDGGAGVHNWSTQVHWDADSGQVISDFDEGVQNEVPFSTGVWAPLRVVINLYRDEQTIYYNDLLVIRKGWTSGVGHAGHYDLKAHDFFGNDASEVYYDNIQICTVLPVGACCTEDGMCQLLVEAACDEEDGGQFQGIGSWCDAVKCLVFGPLGWEVEIPITSDARYSDDTTRRSRDNCDNTGDGILDDQVRFGPIPFPGTWTITTCLPGTSGGVRIETGAPWDPAAFAGAALCGFELGEGDDECDGDDPKFTVEIPSGAFDQGDVFVTVSLEGVAGEEEGTYTLRFCSKCPVIEDRDGDSVRDALEVDCFDGQPTDANGGCNSTPPVFSAATCDTVFNGTVGNFIFDATTNRRDLDWYRLDLEETTNLALSARGQFPLLNLLVWRIDSIGQGEDECSNTRTLARTVSGACGAVASLDVDLEPGKYILIIFPDRVNPGDVDCGVVCGDASYYEMTVDCGGLACPEDLSGNGIVDFEDILEVLAAWGNKGGPEDLDGNGVVDFGDILAVLSAWGPCV